MLKIVIEGLYKIIHITCIIFWEDEKKKLTISNEFHFTSNVVSETYHGGGGYHNNEGRKGEEVENIIPTFKRLFGYPQLCNLSSVTHNHRHHIWMGWC